jgi:polyadenylate-binding protein
MRDEKTQTSKGFGFVCFKESASAQQAVNEAQKVMLDGRPLYVAFAQSKAARTQQIQAAVNMHMVAKQGQVLAEKGVPVMAYPYASMMPYPGSMMPGGFSVYQPSGPGSRKGRGNAFLGAQPMHPAQMGMGPGMGGRGGRGNRGRGGRGMLRSGAYPRSNPTERDMAHQDDHSGHSQENDPVHARPQEPLAARLARMSEAECKQYLGELLYPKLRATLMQQFGSEEHSTKLASKVTGMFLEMETSGLLYLLETEKELRVKLGEALDVLREHGGIPSDLS